MKKAQLAVIGCGAIAQKQHIANISMSKNGEINTLCDCDIDKVKKLSEFYEVSHLEADYRKVLANPEIEGVIIATKHDTHVSLTVEALEAGKHVYVEKPLAETKEECEKVIAARNKAGKTVIVGMNRRMAPSYLHVKKILQKHGGAKNIFYRVADPCRLDNWYIPEQRMILENCHIFDILRFFTESEVKSVYVARSRPDDELITMRFTNDSCATILSSGYVGRDMPKEHLEIIAERGAVTVEDFVELRTYSLAEEEPVKNFPGHIHPMHDCLNGMMYKRIGREAMLAVRREEWEIQNKLKELQKTQGVSSPEYKKLFAYQQNTFPICNYNVDKGWLNAMEHFCDIILSGVNNIAATPEDAFEAARITEAAIQSRDSGKIVNIEK